MNPILAVPAFLAGYIEHSGTGTTDIVNYCKQAGLREPEFIQDEDFRVIIWRKRANADGPQSGPQEKLAQRYRGLLETIVAKPTISKEDLAAQFKISLTTLKRDLRSLRQSYEITWIGWTQNGHWEVKELEKKKQ